MQGISRHVTRDRPRNSLEGAALRGLVERGRLYAVDARISFGLGNMQAMIQVVPSAEWAVDTHRPHSGGALPQSGAWRHGRHQGRRQLLAGAHALPAQGCMHQRHAHFNASTTQGGQSACDWKPLVGCIGHMQVCMCVKPKPCFMAICTHPHGASRLPHNFMHALAGSSVVLLPVHATHAFSVKPERLRWVALRAQVLVTQLAAKSAGYADVVYLDAKTDTLLEEVSSCNIFTVQGRTIRTPPLSVRRMTKPFQSPKTAHADTFLGEVSSCNIFSVQGRTIRTPPLQVRPRHMPSTPAGGWPRHLRPLHLPGVSPCF